MENIAKSWMKRFDKVTDFDAFMDALYEFESKSDYASPPTTKQWLDLYRSMKGRKTGDETAVRRIVTPEEQMYNIYLEEMNKPVNQRDEWLIRQCLPAAKIMTDPEAYRRHFGKPREEYEKL